MPGRYRSDTLEQRISIERLEQAVNIFGSFDENIRLLEQEFSVTVVNRDGELRVEGEPEDTMLACKAIQALLTLSSRGEAIGEQNVRYVIGLVRSGKESQITELTGDVLCISAKGRPIKPKTIGQKEYIKSVLKNTVTIGVGPAGTGKTYLAVAAAVQAFRDKQVNRIILTRPAVEAGERLGFLPGTCNQRWIPTCGRCTTPSSTCWGRRPIRSIWSGATLRWPLWPICGAGRWTTASSSWTRHRTPPGSR